MIKKTLIFLTAGLIAISSAGLAFAQEQNNNQNLQSCQGITFNRQFEIGSTGQDVKCLQELLNRDPDTRIATTGPGSPGNETDYFGEMTMDALRRFSQKFADGQTAFSGPLMQKFNDMLNGIMPDQNSQDQNGQQDNQNQNNQDQNQSNALPAVSTAIPSAW